MSARIVNRSGAGAAILSTLLAVLLHALLAQTDPIYQQLRQELATRRTFFTDIRTLTRYLICASWRQLLLFMFVQLALAPQAPASLIYLNLRIAGITISPHKADPPVESVKVVPMMVRR